VHDLLLRGDLVPFSDVVNPDFVVPANGDDVIAHDARKRRRRQRLGVTEQGDDGR